MNEILLDESVQRRISRKARRVVDFEQAWIQFVVDHDVEPENLEAHIICEVVRV